MPQKPPPPRYVLLPRPPGAWNRGYRCLLCSHSTGFWPDDGSAEEDIYTHLSRAHPEEDQS